MTDRVAFVEAPRPVSRRIPRGFLRERLEARMNEKGLKPGELARLADLSSTTIYDLLNGHTTPYIDNLVRIAEVLESSHRDFLDIPLETATLADLRFLLGKTQPALATAAGLRSAAALGHLERGNTRMTAEKAAALAAAFSELGVSADGVQAAWRRARTRLPKTAP